MESNSGKDKETYFPKFLLKDNEQIWVKL